MHIKIDALKRINIGLLIDSDTQEPVPLLMKALSKVIKVFPG